MISVGWALPTNSIFQKSNISPIVVYFTDDFFLSLKVANIDSTILKFLTNDLELLHITQ